MMLLHFLQRILKTLPRTFSSAIEYLAEQASQTIFIVAPEARGIARPNLRQYRKEARTGATRPLGTLRREVCWRFFFQAPKGSRKRMLSAPSEPNDTSHMGTPVSRSRALM